MGGPSSNRVQSSSAAFSASLSLVRAERRLTWAMAPPVMWIVRLQPATRVLAVAGIGALLERLFRAADVHAGDGAVSGDVIVGIFLVARQARRLAGALDRRLAQVAVGAADEL